MSRHRQPLPPGQWAEPGITLAARINAIKAEAIASDIPTFNAADKGQVFITAAALWIGLAAAAWALWTGSPP